MSSTARPMVGTSMTWGGSTTSLEIKSINFGGFSKPVANVSHFGSTWADKISVGVVDGGNVSFELNWDADLSEIGDTFMVDLIAGTAKEVVITYPGSPVWKATFNAIITGFTPGSGGLEDAGSASMTMEIVGACTVDKV